MSAKSWFRRIVGESEPAPSAADTVESPDLVDNTRQLLSNLLAHLRTRLELLGLELSIEKTRLLRTIAAGMLTGFFGLMSLGLGALYVVARYWDTPYRLIAVAWLMFAAFVLTALAALWLLQSLRQPSVLFSASAAELDRDIEVLEKA
jgi:uncharacterized membrane protein YqjE